MKKLKEHITKNRRTAFAFILITNLLLLSLLSFIISNPQLPLIFFGSILLFVGGMIFTTFYFWPGENNVRSFFKNRKLFILFSAVGFVFSLGKVFESESKTDLILNISVAVLFFATALELIFAEKIKDPYSTLIKGVLAILWCIYLALL